MASLNLQDNFENKHVDGLKIDVSSLNTFSKGLEQKRATLENEWKVQEEFFNMNPYTYVNSQGKMERLKFRAGQLPSHIIRMRGNQLTSSILLLLAKVTKEDPMFEAQPTSNSHSDIRSTRVAEDLMAYWWDEFVLGNKLAEVMLWAFVCGHGWIETGWNSKANKPFDVYRDPATGQVVTDEAAIEGLRQQYAASGQELPVEVQHLGDLFLNVLAPYDIYLIGDDDEDKAIGVLKVQGWSVEAIQERWGKKLKPDSKDKNVDDKQHPYVSDQVKLRELYVKPCSFLPEGLYCVFSKTEILQKTAYPYPDIPLPFIRFNGLPVPGRRRNISHVELMMDDQLSVNRTTSQIEKIKNLTSVPQVWVPNSANIPDSFNFQVPGARIPYNVGPNGEKPEWAKLPPLPDYMMAYLNDKKQDLQRASGTNDATQGEAPNQVQSGIGIMFLQEQDDTRLGIIHKQMERSLSKLGTIMLKLAQKYYIEQRTLRIAGPSGSTDARTFSNTDLTGSDAIRVVAGSTMSTSKAANRADVLELVKNGKMDLNDALPFLQLGGKNQLLAYLNQAKGKQQREIDNLLAGTPLPQPEEWENHPAAMEVLTCLFNSPEFERPPYVSIIDQEGTTVGDLLKQHYQQHSQMFQAAQPQSLPDGVKANLQIRGDATPSETQAILGQSGIQTPPLEQVQAEEAAREQVKAQSSAQAQADASIQKDTAQHDLQLEKQALDQQAQQEQQDKSHVYNVIEQHLQKNNQGQGNDYGQQ